MAYRTEYRTRGFARPYSGGKVAVSTRYPATERQIAFLLSLAADRDFLSLIPADRDMVTSLREWTAKREAAVAATGSFAELPPCDKFGASKLIEALKVTVRADATSFRPAGAPAPRPMPAVAVTELGYYELDEHTVAEVVRARSTGRLYAKRIDLATGEATYAGGLIFKITPDQKITLARAQELGRINGRCVRCHTKLTDPKSVADGIGPVCKKYSHWA